MISALVYRLITRAALINLTREYRSTEEQDQLDQEMEEAMAQAHASVGVIVSVGKQMMHSSREQLVNITERVHKCLPTTISRVEFSYALLTFATLKVTDILIY